MLKSEKTDTDGPKEFTTPLTGHKPTSIVDQLDRAIENLPHDEVQKAYDDAKKALEEGNGMAGAALKKVARTVFSLLIPT